MADIIKVATREAYGKALVELGEKNDKVVVLDADLAAATKTGMFKKAFPDRFFDAGIAECNMIGVAAGLLFKALSKTKLGKAFSAGVCGFCGALTNTILVMGGIYLFFGRSYSAAKDQEYETLIGTVMATITGIGITKPALLHSRLHGQVDNRLFLTIIKTGHNGHVALLFQDLHLVNHL